MLPKTRPTMTTDAVSTARLYTTDILGLAVALADYPLGTREWARRAEARAPVCGSTMAIGLDLGPDNTVADLGVRVQACAIGQAAAAIFAQDSRGNGLAAIESAQAAIADWLTGDGPLPAWPGFAQLEPARAFPGRHGAIILPWKAAIRALSPGAVAS